MKELHEHIDAYKFRESTQIKETHLPQKANFLTYFYSLQQFQIMYGSYLIKVYWIKIWPLLLLFAAFQTSFFSHFRKQVGIPWPSPGPSIVSLRKPNEYLHGRNYSLYSVSKVLGDGEAKAITKEVLNSGLAVLETFGMSFRDVST